LTFGFSAALFFTAEKPTDKIVYWTPTQCRMLGNYGSIPAELNIHLILKKM
jgi:hypothetical protein